ASGAGAYYQGASFAATPFTVYGAPKGEDGLEAVETAVDAEIAKIVKDGISDSELEKAKNRYLRSLIFARDNQSGMANLYGGSLTTGNTVRDVQEWPERIRAVTAAQVQAVAAKYLKPNTSVASYLLPKTEAPKVQN
ncbi:MAG: insulinase family protein, partial [Rhizobiaceae bacterium]